MCTKERLLDIIENFVAFQDLPGGFVKLLARNHQYLGVNNALARMQELRHAPPEERGKLGVFWHTQGSGKTMSMLFFSQKVLRKMPGNWSFVIVTDREDLDEQAYKEFLWAGVVTEKHMRATSSAHLRQLLGEDHRYVFTLIQKFRTEKGETHPVVSDRDDVIVITDEAHRTQYDTLALNMRNALPNAGFLGFTGTPLIAGEERTREVFGDYVSIYNFAASAADHATVPLYYENRIPQLEIANPTFGDDLMAIVEEADLDEAQERQLARALGQQYELITRDDRLDAVAKDIVDHFLGRGFPGKAHGRVHRQGHRRPHVRRRSSASGQSGSKRTRSALQRGDLTPGGARPARAARSPSCARTDMAVVISQSQNEIAEMAERGHRHQAAPQAHGRGGPGGQVQGRPGPVPASPSSARCGRPGFDVPSLSTVYLDKPLRNHTLMQTITRANRVFPEKNNGLIVAYVDVFRNLQKALAIYAIGGKPGEVPVEEKGALVDALREAVEDLRAFCAERDVDLDALGRLKGFELVARRQADGRDADGRRRREDRLPVPRRAGRPSLQGDPARHAGQRVQPRPGGLEVPRRRHRRLHRAPRHLRRHGPSRAAPRRVRRRPGVPDPRQRGRGPVRPRRGGLGGPRGGVQAGTPAHRRSAPAVAALGPDHRARPAQSRCGSTWSSGSRSWSPTTTPGA